MKKIVIIADKPGRMGNLLLIHYHFLSLIKDRNDIILINPTVYQHLEHTKTLHWNSSDRVFTPKHRLSFDIAHLIFRACRFFKINNKIIGHIDLGLDKTYDLTSPKAFQSKVTFFSGFWLESNATALSQSSSFVKHKIDKRDEVSVTVGLHIRRTDYKNAVNGQFYFSLDRYFQWTKQILLAFERFNCKVIICTDCYDELLAREDFASLEAVNIRPKGLYEDFRALVDCDYIVGPPSTFSVCAALVSGNKILFLEHENIEINPSLFSEEPINSYTSSMKNRFLESNG